MITENGWPSCTRAQCDDILIPGTGETLPFQHGIPAIVLPALMADLNQFVESTNNAAGYRDEGSWTPTNSVGTSNHLGGTAFDYNWNDHPMGIALDGWHGSDIIQGEEEPEIRRILNFYTFEDVQMAYWGNDWNSPKDSMHFQMGYGTYEDQLKVWRFINYRIRADGFSTYRRGGTPRGGVPTVPVPGATVNVEDMLAEAMGRVSGVDYASLAPYVTDCLVKSSCTNNNRIAMWCAQIGHESVGLKYMKEIGDAAYFARYNNRADLGNGPTDGPRYPGRGPIQITGRANYRNLSKWAYAERYVDTPTFFEDNPTELENYKYAFLGAVWYWTVARPDINSLCDQGDIVTVTRRINGGTNGLDDRTNRWNHCRTMDLIPLLEGEDDLSAEAERKIAELHEAFFGEFDFESLSPLRKPGEGKVGNLLEFIRWMDSNIHVVLEIMLVKLRWPDPDSVALLEQIIASNEPGRERDRKLAKAILDELSVKPTSMPSVVQAPAVVKTTSTPVVVQAPAVVTYSEPEVLPAIRSETSTSTNLNSPNDLLNTIDKLNQFNNDYRTRFAKLTGKEE